MKKWHVDQRQYNTCANKKTNKQNNTATTAPKRSRSSRGGGEQLDRVGNSDLAALLSLLAV
jgi:hypothetical protein